VLELGFVANLSTVARALMVTRDLVVATTFGANILFLSVHRSAHGPQAQKQQTKIGRMAEVSRRTAWQENHRADRTRLKRMIGTP
jgi:hypothetical protein